MVDDTGIEPVTPSMSTKCSTAELITPYVTRKPAPQTKTGREIYAPVAGSINRVAGMIKGFWLCKNMR